MFRWFDVQLESWYQSPRQVAVSVQWPRVFKHQQLNTTVSPCCGPLFAVKNSTAHTSQLISLLGLVWVSLAHLAITLLHGIPTHTTIWQFKLCLWQGGACSTPTETLQSGFDAQPCDKSACRCIASKWMLRQNSRVVFLQQACSWVVAARSESKGSKALHDDSGCIYPSRPCSQVELLQSGCSRKLVWISQSVKWFDVQLEGWRESKTGGCKCPMIKSVQASADLDTLSAVLLASSVCILAIVNWCTWQRHWRSIGHYKVSQPTASCLKPQEHGSDYRGGRFEGTSTCPDCVRWGRIELQRLSFTTLLQHSSCVQKWAILWLCTDSHDRWENSRTIRFQPSSVQLSRKTGDTSRLWKWVTGGQTMSEHAGKAAACLRLCSPCLHLRIVPNKCPFGAKLPLACHGVPFLELGVFASYCSLLERHGCFFLSNRHLFPSNARKRVSSWKRKLAEISANWISRYVSYTALTDYRDLCSDCTVVLKSCCRELVLVVIFLAKILDVLFADGEHLQWMPEKAARHEKQIIDLIKHMCEPKHPLKHRARVRW